MSDCLWYKSKSIPGIIKITNKVIYEPDLVKRKQVIKLDA